MYDRPLSSFCLSRVLARSYCNTSSHEDTMQQLPSSYFICFNQDFEEEALTAKPLIYSHFSSGVGEPKYLACSTWENLSKILVEALDSYNEVNAAMNLVLFEDAMAHVYVPSHILELNSCHLMS